MNFAWIILLAIYVLVSLILYDSVERGTDNATTIALCITWPLIFVGFVLIAALLVIVGLMIMLLRGLCNLWESFNGK